MEKCIITACSNRFFPSLLNLLGSIKANYPNHPKIYVYSLGLLPILKNELKNIAGVEVIDMPHFCAFWKKCYTWKTYIFTNPLSELNLFLDAGNEILMPLDEMFEQIENNGYFTVSQITKIKDIVPKEYGIIFKLTNEQREKECIGSGIFGFNKHDNKIKMVLDDVFESAICGLCLGYSANEKYRNKGREKTFFTRNCDLFRHEQTMLNIFLNKHIDNYKINSINKYAGSEPLDDNPKQLIWNLRRNSTRSKYTEEIFTNHNILKEILLGTFFILLSCKKFLKKII